jgi:hypothetical protein
MKKYTVLLLYPDYMTDGPEGSETYLAWVFAATPVQAVTRAQLDAKEASDYDCDEEQNPEDFRALAVFKGHHDDIRP